MDNNFIKIDDLVRQHLEGAEEKERAGAWLKMRDLLDEEMPRKKRVGIIYWKRIFGLVAAASLIGTMAVGSYELSSVYRRSASHDPMSATSGKDFSRESGPGTMDVQPAWMGDEPATSGKISIRGTAHNPSANDAAITTAPEKPYNGGGNSNYMAAISSAASADASKRNTGSNSITTASTSNGSATTSTNSLATTNARPLPANTTAVATAPAHSIPVTKNNTYSNTQETGTIHAKRNQYTSNSNNWQGTATNSNGESRIVPNNPVNDDAARRKNNKTNKSQNSIIPTSIVCDNTNSNSNTTGAATTNNGGNNSGAARRTTRNNNKNLSCSVKTRHNRHNGNNIPRIATTTGTTMPTYGTPIADAGMHTLPTGNIGGNSVTGTPATDKIGALNATTAGMSSSTTSHLPANAHTVPGTATAQGTEATKGNRTTSSHHPSASGTGESGSIKGHRNAKNNTMPGTATTAQGTLATASNAGHRNHTGSGDANTGPDSHTAGYQATASHNTSTSGESGTIKGHRNAKNTTAPNQHTNTGHGVANTTVADKTDNVATKTTGAKTHVATTPLASSTTVGKHNAHTSGKTPEVADDENIINQETEETAQKQEGDKKVITKIVLRQREIKNGNETHTQVDTVSMEKFSKQSGIPAEDNDPLSGNVTAKRGTNAPVPAAAEPDTDNKPGTAEKATGSKKHRKRHNTGEELAAAPAATTDAEDAPRTTMADAPADNTAAASANPSEVATKKKTSDRKTGASLLQKLSSAFNDVKQNATGAKFTPGITAGINSNFFGPSKMMGFQFGATGSFDFNETWSLMAELKYFNRINNNNIEDNYYSYTDMGNGQYRRELVRNTYDFAAMHTLEMPLTIRYAKGNFNFYAGGNLQYAFSINTAPATTPDPTAQATFVSAPGTDNKPTYTEADFRSRFALGYIFGFSYQIAPNTSLDIRNVQSVWDNAATTGARSISNMLYRTPSVQLSVMYRLGGNKNKE